jgi:hypothetical protein
MTDGEGPPNNPTKDRENPLSTRQQGVPGSRKASRAGEGRILDKAYPLFHSPPSRKLKIHRQRLPFRQRDHLSLFRHRDF